MYCTAAVAGCRVRLAGTLTAGQQSGRHFYSRGLMGYAVISNTAVLLDITVIDHLLRQWRLLASGAARGRSRGILRHRPVLSLVITGGDVRVVLGECHCVSMVFRWAWFLVWAVVTLGPRETDDTAHSHNWLTAGTSPSHPPATRRRRAHSRAPPGSRHLPRPCGRIQLRSAAPPSAARAGWCCQSPHVTVKAY